MRVYKNLFGDGSKINVSEIVYKERRSDEVKNLEDSAYRGLANCIAYYGDKENQIDPNTTENFLIVTAHENAPSFEFWFILTLFMSSKTNNRTQLALGYGHNRMFIRNYYNGEWSNWVEK